MITIGWRGAEEEFLKKLKFARQMPAHGIKHAMRLFVIGAGGADAEETKTNTFNGGGRGAELFLRFVPSEPIPGFSGLMDRWQTLRELSGAGTSVSLTQYTSFR